MTSPRSSTDARTLAQNDQERQQNFAKRLEVPLQRASTNPTPTVSNAYNSKVNDLSTPSPSLYNGTISTPKSILPTGRAWKTFFAQEVAQGGMLEAQLMALTISTGILDATTFATYSVFATKQTGNTLFLALFALAHPVLGPEVEQCVAVSIATFILGGAFFGHLARHVRQRRRAWLLATNLFQSLLIFAATAIRFWGPKAKSGGPALGVIALLSFASSGQIAMAVGVGLPELNTTMITGSLVQLSYDPRLFCRNNHPRTRRVLFYLSLLGGCFVGSAAHFRDASLGFLLTAVVKMLVSVSFLFNPGMMRSENDDSEKAEGSGIAGTATPISKILWGD